MLVKFMKSYVYLEFEDADSEGLLLMFRTIFKNEFNCTSISLESSYDE